MSEYRSGQSVAKRGLLLLRWASTGERIWADMATKAGRNGNLVIGACVNECVPSSSLGES